MGKTKSNEDLALIPPYQGRNMKGMTPYAVFKKGLPK